MTARYPINDEFETGELFPDDTEQENQETPEESSDAPLNPEPLSDAEALNHTANQEMLILTIKPEHLPSGSISIRELTQIAGGLQDLTDSVANTIYNQPSEKGRIPEDILENSRMVLHDIKPETFQAVLTIQHPEQTSLEKPDIITTLQELFSLFDTSYGADQLAAKIAELGPRTFRIYTDWTKAIAEAEAPVHIAWHSAYHDMSAATFDPEQADRIYQLLADFSDTNEDVSVTGKFTGVNIRTGAFELMTEEGERISGTTSRDAMTAFLSVNFNHIYAVELLKIVVDGQHINAKTAWTLKGITPASS